MILYGRLSPGVRTIGALSEPWWALGEYEISRLRDVETSTGVRTMPSSVSKRSSLPTALDEIVR